MQLNIPTPSLTRLLYRKFVKRRVLSRISSTMQAEIFGSRGTSGRFNLIIASYECFTGSLSEQLRAVSRNPFLTLLAIMYSWRQHAKMAAASTQMAVRLQLATNTLPQPPRRGNNGLDTTLIKTYSILIKVELQCARLTMELIY